MSTHDHHANSRPRLRRVLRAAGYLPAVAAIALILPTAPAQASLAGNTLPAATTASAPTRETPAATPAVSGIFIRNVLSGRCTRIVGASTAVGAPVEQGADCSADTSKLWQPINAADSSGILLRNLHSRLCLHIAGGSTANGARADQALCNLSGGDHAMVWREIFSEDGTGWLLQSVHSNRCLHVVAASRANGARLDQVGCVAGGRDHAQVWVFPGGTA